MPNRLFNPSQNIVQQAIDGCIFAAGGSLTRLQYTDDNIQVVLQSPDSPHFNSHSSNVALISGGGSGHEPSHPGWVGKGMLTAAVCGDIFASPSTDAVHAAIKATNSIYPGNAFNQGVILIVKNYTGDRLNFGIAAERAKKDAIPTKVVMVADDIAIENAPQPRGIAGTVLVHKVAGAAADQGRNLQQVFDVANIAAKHVYTIGMALTTCVAPAADTPDAEPSRLGNGRVEYGLGIHGEPGAKETNLASSEKTCADLVAYLASHLKDKLTHPYALLINNLGTLPPLELSVVVNDVLKQIHIAGFTNVTKLAVNTAMTSLNMSGFSLTLFDLSCLPDAEALLDAPTSATAWKPFVPVLKHLQTIPIPQGIATSQLQIPSQAEIDRFTQAIAFTVDPQQVSHAIHQACSAIIQEEPRLTKQDLIVGDGDCGQTLKQGAQRILADLQHYPLTSIPHTLDALAHSVAASMGGTSGILYSLGFQAAATHIFNAIYDPADSIHSHLVRSNPFACWSSALKAATDAISFYGGATVGMRTMMDALIPAADAAVALAVTATTPPAPNDLEQVVNAAQKGANATAQLKKAKAGRSAYVPEDHLTGIEDPGATAVAIWIKAIVDATH